MSCNAPRLRAPAVRSARVLLLSVLTLLAGGLGCASSGGGGDDDGQSAGGLGEYAGCPPVLTLDTTAQWALAPRVRYRARRVAADAVVVRAEGTFPAGSDVRLAYFRAPTAAVGAAAAAAAEAQAKAAVPVLGLYRQLTPQPASRAKESLRLCVHIRTNGPVNRVTIHDREGPVTILVENAAD